MSVATAGQFTSADTLQTDLNRYAYAGNSPETNVDPDGHCWPLCTMVIGALVRVLHLVSAHMRGGPVDCQSRGGMLSWGQRRDPRLEAGDLERGS